jgi:hypothetical protein
MVLEEPEEVRRDQANQERHDDDAHGLFQRRNEAGLQFSARVSGRA